MDFDEMVEAIEEWKDDHTIHSFARAIKEVYEDEEVALLIENLYSE